MSVKVKLEDGEMERFHRSYIVGSLETVGLDHITAKGIAKDIEKHKGMTEHDIKIKIFQKLDEIDPKIATKYKDTKKVRVSSESMQADGNALIPEFLMSYLELRNGDKIDVFHGNKNSLVRVNGLKDMYHHQDHNMIFLSDRDMKDIDIKERSLVAICKHQES